MTLSNKKKIKKYKLFLFGGNRLKEEGPLLKTAIFLKKNKFSYICFVHKTHLKKKISKSKDLEDSLIEKKINFIKLSKLNNKFIRRLLDKDAFGISINSIWKFKPSLIKMFKGNLFNYHASDLPTERGAANLSWKIMMRKKINSSICIHQINNDFDEGNIIFKKKVKFNWNLLPYQNLKYVRNIEYKMIKSFIMKFQKKKFKSKLQNNSQSMYFPRLNSDRDGKICWDWKADDIVLFIKAFSKPFNGAFSYLKNRKVRIFNAKKIKSKIKFHPFQNGIIYKYHKKNFYIASEKNTILISEKDITGIRKNKKYYLGKKFK